MDLGTSKTARRGTALSIGMDMRISSSRYCKTEPPNPNRAWIRRIGNLAKTTCPVTRKPDKWNPGQNRLSDKPARLTSQVELLQVSSSSLPNLTRAKTSEVQLTSCLKNLATRARF